MAPLSTGEAAELPDSTYPGNRLPRSFFWRGSNKLAPPPGPQSPHPYSSPSISSLWKSSDDGVGKPTPTSSVPAPHAQRLRRAGASRPQPRPCGASAPPPDRQQPMSGFCCRPLRTARTLPAADAAGLARQRSFHGDRGWARAASRRCHGDKSRARAPQPRLSAGSEPRGAAARARSRGGGGTLGPEEALFAHRDRRYRYRESAEGRSGPP